MTSHACGRGPNTRAAICCLARHVSKQLDRSGSAGLTVLANMWGRYYQWQLNSQHQPSNIHSYTDSSKYKWRCFSVRFIFMYERVRESFIHWCIFQMAATPELRQGEIRSLEPSLGLPWVSESPSHMVVDPNSTSSAVQWWVNGLRAARAPTALSSGVLGRYA